MSEINTQEKKENNGNKGKEEIIHGWYSSKQFSSNKKSIYYLNMNNKVIQVTHVSRDENADCNFGDIMYLGTLQKHIPNFYVENYGYDYDKFKDKMLK